MSPSTETILDYDRSVGTEDRFAVRRFLDAFVTSINTSDFNSCNTMLSDALTIEGFSDFVMLKENFVGMLKRKFFGQKNSFVRFPKLHLSYSRFMFSLTGTYEEFIDSIIVTEGTIELKLVKNDDQFLFAKIRFYPRMIMRDSSELVL